MMDKLKSGSIFDSLRLFWQLLAKEILNEKRLLISGFVLAIVTAILAILVPYAMQLIIDNAIPVRDINLLNRYTIGLVCGLILGFCLWYIQVSFTARASENIFCSFKLRLSEAILKKHLSFFSRYHSGDLLTRMVSDLEIVSEFFYKYLLRSLVLFVFILVLFIYIFFLNWKMSLIALLGIPVMGIIMASMDKLITRTSNLSRKLLSAQNDRVLDMLQGHREIRFFQQHKKILTYVESSYRDCAEANVQFTKTMNGLTESLLGLAGGLFFFLPIIAGGYAICLGRSDISIGLIISFQVYLMILSDEVRGISIGFAESIKAAPAIERLLEIINYQIEEQPRLTNLNDIPESMVIEFKQMTFGYLKDNNILTNFNLRIEPSEKICIMGESGSGKTTIANLLLRFLSPDAGEITLGEINIQNYPLASYLSHFSYVWQDTYLFHLSIKENIKLGWSDVPDDIVKEIVAQVGLKQTIESLPDQYDTVIGKNGINFSGGQRQRIALARALIRGPEILILDEFTSALDLELEQKMLNDIFTLFKHQTIVCITHSELVAKRFDRIVMLENQKVI
ncbi:MAG: ABC transporter ATP-binding protein [Desulfobacterales bacterium]|nr:ABC transporter ATP-binding protein [Desulfobacterales bacterium]